MRKRNPMPSAQTNPLADDFDDLPQRNADFDADSDIEDANIQTGMPTRNLRSIAVGVMAIALTAFLLWPGSGTKTEQEIPVSQETDIAGDLVDRLSINPAPVALPEYPEIKVPEAIEKASSPKVDERVELALISPMAASDVELRTAGKAQGQGRESSKVDAAMTFLQEQDAGRKALVERLDKMRQSQSFGSNGAGLGLLGNAGQSGLGGSSEHNMYLAQHSVGGEIGRAEQLQPARHSPTLYEGTIIRTVLTRALNSDLPGTITARVSSDLYDSISQRILLVPRGSEVTCSYDSNLHQGQKVILAACTRLRLPNGRSFALAGTPAGNEQGATGIPAEINNHFWEMFGTAIVVGASSYLLPKSDRNITIVDNAENGSQTAGNIMGSALSQVVQATIARNVQIPPTGTVEIGTPFTLTLTRDVEMEPYLASQRRGM